MKGEGDSTDSWGGGVPEHHDLCFSVVNTHTTSLCAVLAGVYHGLELCWGSGHKYHVIGIEEGSNPFKLVKCSDVREFEEWEFGSQFEREGKALWHQI